MGGILCTVDGVSVVSKELLIMSKILVYDVFNKSFLTLAKPFCSLELVSRGRYSYEKYIYILFRS